MEITHAVLLLISLFSGLFYNTARNYCMKHSIRTDADNYLFNIISGIFTSLALLVMIIVRGELAMPSLYTLLFGVLFGVITALCAIVNMQALGVGPMSYTTVIISCSMIIPSFYGAFFRADAAPLTWVHYVGIVLMLGCIILSVTKDANEKKTGMLWFVCCIVAFAMNGSIGIMQQIHQSSTHASELDLFLLVAFSVSIVYSVIGLLVSKCAKKQEVTVSVAPKHAVFWLAAFVGVTVAAVNVINMFLAGAMDSAVFFPIINGGGLILTALTGILLFREKFSVKKWIGLLLGIIAIALLCLEKIYG